ncbi:MULTISPECIES: helix-turn-helix domain-containing protein [unclassified Achromobacter]|uniref:helix-turn-helix domain-containing protein n=1 Tax=unclassified Achromobacter TaxID=2626865 RepID=UPI000B51788D|nr:MULTISPECIES: helix-turn-helix domain-containing protein [unclassified Achromobacter]OWT69222.1 Hin recombinase [Achromobacter sp. HZ34]OWT70627.1 Hin recombinase [Achromobacter sp. HZ28]
MARPSKLTDVQWETIGKRLLAGEAAAALAREFGVSKAAISVRFSKRNENIKIVANQIVDTERALSKLNVSEQMAARSLADDLKAISEHLAGAARYSAATSHRLASMAHVESEKIDDTDPTSQESVKALQGVALLTKMANTSSEIGINLLRANKEQVDGMNRGDDEAPAGLEHFYGDSAV